LLYIISLYIYSMKKRFIFFLIYSLSFLISYSQEYYLLKADKVFDGEQIHTDWVVLVHNNLIEYAGTPDRLTVPVNTKTIELKNSTLMPGMIEGHSHLFLHPYNETSWNDQVLMESRAERVARATIHAKKTLLAGFTTVRDLGTEGAEYDDVGLKQAIEKHVIPGPRMIVATRAIVTTGSYGPRNLSNDLNYIKAAAEADGTDALIKEVRTQIGKGADVIKLYADYYWGPGHKAMPTFTVEELKLAVEVAKSSGRQVAVHATSAEGMRRAIFAGVSTIEHGTEGTLELFKMMKEKGIAYCPTLSADEAISMYRGWKKAIDPEPENIKAKRKTFRLAMESGVTICMGGDVGVFAHGDNAREMETMASYGMKNLDVLKCATSVNADVFNMDTKIGRIKKGLFADIIAVEGDPLHNVSQVRKIKLVMKDGVIYLQE
jgi:imidazolonepropionase-like amidohydrolase